MFDFQYYQPQDRHDWNAFVAAARNGVFLFDRDYLEYHADRFEDASIMVRERRRNELMAVLPANRCTVAGESWLNSHGGLTFGGLVMHPKLAGAAVPVLLEQLLAWLSAQGISGLNYRPVPHIFHQLASEDDLYALHHLGGRLVGVQLSSTIDLQRPCPASGRRSKAARNAQRAGVVTDASTLAAFWPLLEQTLQRRHGVMPVHTLAEIQLLASRFDCIQCVGACRPSDGDAGLLAGALLYHYAGVTHTQYLAASAEGYRVSAMNAVIEHVIELARQRQDRWLSFGVSTSDGGRVLNEGLLEFKEVFGARSTILQTYEIRTRGKAS